MDSGTDQWLKLSRQKLRLWIRTLTMARVEVRDMAAVRLGLNLGPVMFGCVSAYGRACGPELRD